MSGVCNQIFAASDALLDVNLGGTAVGTGLAAPEGFASHALEHLRRISGLPLRSPDRLVSATTDPTALLGFSAALRTCAVALAKLADDLRLLSSGPRTGLAEVELGSGLGPSLLRAHARQLDVQDAVRVVVEDHHCDVELRWQTTDIVVGF